MIFNKVLLLILTFKILLFIQCEQKENSDRKTETNITAEKPLKLKYENNHPYGGWSCPDNLRGFPPVNIKEIEQVPVVNGRLPTKEETQTGISLIYFDKKEFPNARPLDITLPRLARYYSDHTKKNEMVIIIQAVVAEKDTVVGFRYLNGGNGSAWYGEVTFISDEEIFEMGETPFIYYNKEINASKEKVWNIITNPDYAKVLGNIFDENAYMESDWQQHSIVYFKNEPDITVATGIITALWKDLYIQIDFNFDGFHYVEKFLFLDNKNDNSSQLYIVAGPYGEDFDDQKIVWNNWLQKVEELCLIY